MFNVVVSIPNLYQSGQVLLSIIYQEYKFCSKTLDIIYLLLMKINDTSFSLLAILALQQAQK